MSAAVSLDWSAILLALLVAAVAGIATAVAAYRWTTRPKAQHRRARKLTAVVTAVEESA